MLADDEILHLKNGSLKNLTMLDSPVKYTIHIPYDGNRNTPEDKQKALLKKRRLQFKAEFLKEIQKD